MQDKKPIKKHPTIFPLGFSVGRTADDIVIIEFIDSNSGELTIINSFALPAKKAKELSDGLIGACEDTSETLREKE